MTRISTIANIREDVTGSAQGRWRDTKVAAGLVAKHPVVGAGIGQDILVMNDERGIDTWRRVHNAYLQYGVDLGLPGLLLFVWLHLTCYRTARAVEQRAAAVPSLRDLQPLATGVKMSLVAFGVAAMFHPIAYHFYFFSVAGLAVALRNTYRTAVGMTAGAGFITHAGRGFTPRQAGREGPPYGYETHSRVAQDSRKRASTPQRTLIFARPPPRSGHLSWREILQLQFAARWSRSPSSLVCGRWSLH
jgi:hypothetical protein